MNSPILDIGCNDGSLLRDLFTSLYGFTTWPCDEIKDVWRCSKICSYRYDDLDKSVKKQKKFKIHK